MDETILIKYLLKETSEAENSAVEKWIEAHPDHRKQYAQIQWIWENGKSLAHKNKVDENAAWDRFLERKEQPPQKRFRSPWRSLYPIWSGTAAAVLILVLGLTVTYLLPHGGKAYFAAVRLESSETSKKEILLDGSTVTLNKTSTLSYSQKVFGNNRTVNLLEGEAYFQVKKDPKRPFIVQAEAVDITVLGTSFNVKKGNTETEIIVDSGTVRVELGGQSVTLQAGEKAIANRQEGILEKVLQENQLFRYYVTNKFEANNTPLGQLVRVLNDAYGSEVTIATDTLKNTGITTTLEYGSLDKNLEVINETLGTQLSKDGGKIILY